MRMHSRSYHADCAAAHLEFLSLSIQSFQQVWEAGTVSCRQSNGHLRAHLHACQKGNSTGNKVYMAGRQRKLQKK